MSQILPIVHTNIILFPNPLTGINHGDLETHRFHFTLYYFTQFSDTNVTAIHRIQHEWLHANNSPSTQTAKHNTPRLILTAL